MFRSPRTHGTTGLTLGCKNLMGTVLNRGQIHANIHQRIADLVSRVKPALTVVDAVRILMDNGPTGGNLNDVKQLNTVIASADIVAADAYGASLFGFKGSDIGYIKGSRRYGPWVLWTLPPLRSRRSLFESKVHPPYKAGCPDRSCSVCSCCFSRGRFTLGAPRCRATFFTDLIL